MNRKDFLKTLGLSSAAIWATYCLGGCGNKNDDVPKPVELPATGLVLDLTLPAYSSLKTVGNFVILTNEKIVVANTSTNGYVAVTRVCSHEGQEQITYLSGNNIFECGAHGAQFNLAGVGILTSNNNGINGLKVYRTELSNNNNTLTIFNN